ncbi:MAG: hypothetical protein U9N61_00140 [Euryarchaeota archaeon]|nr:hypothetical protein [Euryarchaeota archaeon]
MSRLKLTIESEDQLFEQDNATGIVFIKSDKDEITSFEFHRDRNGKLYTNTGTAKSYRMATTLKELAERIPKEERKE